MCKLYFERETLNHFSEIRLSGIKKKFWEEGELEGPSTPPIISKLAFLCNKNVTT